MEIEKVTQEFVCPCCSNTIQFGVIVKVKTINKVEREVPALKEKVEDPLVTLCKGNGLFNKFVDVLKQTQQNVTDIEKYFVTVMNNLKPKNVSRSIVEKMNTNNSEMEFWTFQSISVVTENGFITQIIPTTLLKNEVLSVIKDGSVKRISTDIWQRTRFGYVANPVAFSELRKPSIGAFAS